VAVVSQERTRALTWREGITEEGPVIGPEEPVEEIRAAAGGLGGLLRRLPRRRGPGGHTPEPGGRPDEAEASPGGAASQ